MTRKVSFNPHAKNGLDQNLNKKQLDSIERKKIDEKYFKQQKLYTDF